MESTNQTNQTNEAAAPAATAPRTYEVWNNTDEGKRAIEIIKGKAHGLDGHRAVFANLAEAVARIGAIRNALADAEKGVPAVADIPVAIAGVGDANAVESPDQIPYANGPVIVTALGAKGPKKTGIRGLVIMPNPTVADFMADDEGAAFLAKVVEKEVAHVGLRQLRNVADEGLAAIYAAAATAPISVSQFAQESTRVGVDTVGFDKVWVGLRKRIVEQFPSLAESLPRSKQEVITAIRSASWARTMFPDLESKNLFTGIAALAIKAVDNLTDVEADSDEIAGWVAGRDSYDAPVKERVALTADVDLSALGL